MRAFFKKIQEKTHQTLLTTATSNQIAGSFALGTALAILPTPGLSMLFGLFFSFIFKKIHTLSLALAFIVWNPLIIAPLYVLSYQIGDLLFATKPISPVNIEVATFFLAFSRRFIIGNIFVSLTLATTSFFILKYLVLHKRKKHLKLQKIQT